MIDVEGVMPRDVSHSGSVDIDFGVTTRSIDVRERKTRMI